MSDTPADLNTEDSLQCHKQRSAGRSTTTKRYVTAAVQLVFSKGIDSISFRDVGHEAGLTHGRSYARFEDVEELLVDLWVSVLRASRGRDDRLPRRTRRPIPSDEVVHEVIETSVRRRR